VTGERLALFLKAEGLEPTTLRLTAGLGKIPNALGSVAYGNSILKSALNWATWAKSHPLTGTERTAGLVCLLLDSDDIDTLIIVIFDLDMASVTGRINYHGWTVSIVVMVVVRCLLPNLPIIHFVDHFVVPTVIGAGDVRFNSGSAISSRRSD
jgi:hypothetical protein